MRIKEPKFRLKEAAFSRRALLMAFLAGSPSAMAQQAPPMPPENQAVAATEPDAIEEVIVTATKRSTSLQETPIAVTAINAAALQDAHVQTVQDIVHLVPSFQATSQGDHGVITMTLRGIGNDSAKTEYADPEVAMFVNGIYSPRAEGATSLLFDMDSIEVLRGPQGTLWGRNSTVGAVNMQTARAVLGQTSGQVEAGVGNYNRFGTRGALNLPMGDTFAVRLAFVHEQHDGYVDYQDAPHPSLQSQQAALAAYNAANETSVPFQPLNPNLFVQQGDKYSAQDQSAARASMLWHPSEQLSWNLSLETFADRGTPNMNLMQDPRPGEDRWSALIDTAPYVKRDATTLRSRVDYAINDDLAMAYVAGYSHFTGASDFDQDGGAKVPTSFTTGATYQEDRTNHSRYNNYSHELTLQSSGEHSIDWILGLYYAAEDNEIRFDIPIFNGTQQGTVAWQGSFIQPKETVESKAIFGQTTWNLTQDLHLTGGLRYTADVRENKGGTNNGWDSATTAAHVPVDPSSDPLAPGSGFSTYQHNDGHYSGNKLTYLARVGYDIAKDTLAYASLSSGYKSGGLQDGGVEYGPETLTNYEAGIKNSFFDNRVTFNNAVYYQDFKDFQFSAPVTNTDGSHSLVTSNAEGAKVYGVESEMAAKISRDDLVRLSMAYTHTELGKLIAGSNDYALPPCPVADISNCLDVTGNELPHAPKFAAQLLYEHKFHLANGAVLAPRLSSHYETASWLSVFNDGSGDRQKNYTRTDLGLRYTAASEKPWYVDCFVQNLENSDIRTNAQSSFGVWQSQYLPPRTYGANVGLEF
ncbi:MAG: TonB-dependent receptor [Hydrocarboniphaga sp.]|uniref:TonB-dependent receptor n=1 Tax=Hydrocarboniphaga sp. TaxID=2033016 RepID=UPI0026329049|nr:TonB-dependent receptor [Hydrocarboniphaga sp.]MDB5972474.1 TonB-dependent receptor [Hydrocarboniphaga sp.]